MKLILAIVNNDDSSKVLSGLNKNNFQATKLATTGGFLMSGNTTFLIGVEDENVDKALKIIENCSKKRQKTVPSAPMIDMGTQSIFPMQVTVGGATVFVLNVDRFEKL